MLSNYALTALRALRRQPVQAFINLSGLSLGLACSLLLFVFVRDELAYDRTVPDADRVFRMVRTDSTGGQVFRSAIILGGMAPAAADLYPGIESFARVHQRRSAIAHETQVVDLSQGFAWADPSALDVLGLRLTTGDGATALQEPNTIVLTRELAERLFPPGSDPIGRTVTINDDREATVTGILAPVEGPRHAQFQAMASYASLLPLASPWMPENQGWTYVKLTPEAAAATIEAGINDNLAQIVPWFKTDAMQLHYGLQPVTRIRLHSVDIAGAGNVSDGRYVWLFSGVGLLILLMACVNFMSLTTARATHRFKEVAMRKTLGASRWQLFGQFTGEAVGMSLLALAIAVVVMQMALPFFGAFSGKEITTDYLAQADLIAGFLAMTIAAGLLGGVYPALFLSGHAPGRVMRHGSPQGGAAYLRRALVVFQFGASAALILATLVIHAQLRFVDDRDPGFDPEDVVVMRLSGLQGDQELFRQALLEVPGVRTASLASGLPSGGAMTSADEINGTEVVTHRYLVDAHYMEATGVELKAGRFYDPLRVGDGEESVVVNETMAAVRGWDDPVGQRVVHGVADDGSPRYATVIGVVSDFHTGSLHERISPAYLDARASLARFRQAVLIRVATIDAETIERLTDVWDRHVPARPASLYFADDVVRGLYDAERRLLQIFMVFTVLAATIAALGLFGLAAHAAERRTKEIGIRKVLVLSDKDQRNVF